MKLDTLVSSLSLSCVVGDMPSDFNGVYAGDFLSRAMSRVEADNLWITIMTNVNVIAVASLTDAKPLCLPKTSNLLPTPKPPQKKRG